MVCYPRDSLPTFEILPFLDVSSTSPRINANCQAKLNQVSNIDLFECSVENFCVYSIIQTVSFDWRCSFIAIHVIDFGSA